MEEMDLAIKLVADQSPLVGYWMNWMTIVMVSSLVFVWNHKPARVVALSLPVLMFLAWLVFDQTGEVHLIGIAHVVVWPFLVYYLLKNVMLSKGFKGSSPYGVWVMLLVATMVISLLFDVRDIALVMMGVK